MNALVAIPLAASTAVVALPDSASPQNDTELVGLAAQIKDLHTKVRVAQEDLARCSEIFEEMEPELPQALLWQMDDYVRRSAHLSEDGRPFINMNDVEKLRARTSFHQYHFTGTKEEWDRLGLSNWRDNRIMPVVGYDHLFLSFNDDRREKRAKAIIAAADEYEALWAEANEKSGYRAAEEKVERIYGEMDDAFDRMVSIKPTTLNGYRAMAIAIFHLCWNGGLENGTTNEERMIFAMFSNLLGLERPNLAA
jgi:hypothetical protein